MGAFNPLGSHSSGADISSAVTLTAPAGATKLRMQAITQNVRYTLDGSTPTTSSGFELLAGDPAIIVPIESNTTVKVIEETSAADLEYQWGY